MVTLTTNDKIYRSISKDQAKLINNRQNGRRRGRGGQQARNGQPGNVDRGNRIDNRARGNAAQLLEKYKNLARDAQMQGDRVNTEYYLQFADHYFRVLSESRARFEEQRGGDPREQQQQQRYRRDEFRDEFGPDGDDDSARDESGEQNWNDGDDDRGQNDRVDRPERADRQERRPRYEEQPAEAGADNAEPQQRAEGERRPRRQRNPRGGANGFGQAANEEGVGTGPVSERIEIDRLPQALSPAPSNDDGDAVAEDEAPAPRRRAPRRPRAAPAAAES